MSQSQRDGSPAAVTPSISKVNERGAEEKKVTNTEEREDLLGDVSQTFGNEDDDCREQHHNHYKHQSPDLDCEKRKRDEREITAEGEASPSTSPALTPSSAPALSSLLGGASVSPARSRPLPFSTGASELSRMHHETPELIEKKQKEAAFRATRAAGFLVVEIDKRDGSVSSAAHSSAAVPSTATGGSQKWLKHNESYFSGNSAYNFYTTASNSSNAASPTPQQLVPPSSSSAAPFQTTRREDSSIEGLNALPPTPPSEGGGLGATGDEVLVAAQGTSSGSSGPFLTKIASALGLSSFAGPTSNDRSPSQAQTAAGAAVQEANNSDETKDDEHQSSMVVRVVKKSEAKAAEHEFKRQERIYAQGRGRGNIASDEQGDVGISVNDSVVLGLAKQPIPSSASFSSSGNGMCVDGAKGTLKKKSGGGSKGSWGSAPVEMPTILIPPKSDPLWANARKMYVTFFFSAWTFRMWEFAAIVFIMDGLFPSSLLASSIFGLFEALSGMLTAGPSGALIDRANRMHVMRMGIFAQNLSVVAASVLLAVAIFIGGPALPVGGRVGFLVSVVILGMGGKFGSLLQRMAVMKDWLVVISSDSRPVLSDLNAHIRRTEMFCQIFAPLSVGFASGVFGGGPTCVAIALWSLLSVFVELKLSRVVYEAVPALAVSRNFITTTSHCLPGGNFVLNKNFVGGSDSLPPISSGGQAQLFGSFSASGTRSHGSDGSPPAVPITVAPRTFSVGLVPAIEVSSAAREEDGARRRDEDDLKEEEFENKVQQSLGPIVGGARGVPSVHEGGSDGPNTMVTNVQLRGNPSSSPSAHVTSPQSDALPIATASSPRDLSVIISTSSREQADGGFGAVVVNDSLSVQFDRDVDERGVAGLFNCGTLIRRVNGSMRRTIHAWEVYRAHPCFWVSIPYAILSISVLSFGGIMVSFLKTQGCSDSVLSIGRSVASIISIIPTFVVPYLIPRKGLFRTGRYMLWVQVITLLPIILALLLGLQHVGNAVGQKVGEKVDDVTDTESTPLLFIIVVFVSLCASRVGIWGFDLAQTQMMQELVDKAETGRVNGSQELVVNACWLLSYILTIVFHQPSWFLWPALVSFLATLASALIYTIIGMKTAEAKRETTAGFVPMYA